MKSDPLGQKSVVPGKPGSAFNGNVYAFIPMSVTIFIIFFWGLMYLFGVVLELVKVGVSAIPG